ncbi:hypothetical protein QT383_19710 [Stenotrophomonas rhizophila]
MTHADQKHDQRRAQIEQARHSGLRMAIGLHNVRGFCATAVACATSRGLPDELRQTYSSSPPSEGRFMDYGGAVANFSACSVPGLYDMALTLDMRTQAGEGTIAMTE